MIRKINTAVTLAVVVCVGVAGCGGSDGPATVPVAGTVTLDGEPIADADVHFLSDNFAAAGTTDAEGRFELVQGAVPGKNLVYITKVVGEPLPGDPAQTGIDAYQMELAAEGAGTDMAIAGPEELIPAEYSDPEQSEITYDVPESGTESADFRLRSK